MKTKRVLGVFAVLVGSLVVALALVIILVLDPYGWGTVSSDRFSWEKLSQVQKGWQIESVIELLGDPIKRPENLIALSSTSSDPCYGGTCKKYLFAGARFGASYKEAIVVVDARGRVLRAWMRLE